MTQMCAETYPHFQQEQTDAFDPEQRSRFNEFGELIETPTIEGFVPEDFFVTMARMQARFEAERRAAQELTQTQPDVAASRAEARIRANRVFLMSQQEARRARSKAWGL